MSVTSAVIQ